MTTESWWGEDLLNEPADDRVWAYGASVITYERLRREVAWHRKVLRGYGIGVDSTVAVQGVPSFTQLWTLFALWSLGAQPVLVPPGTAQAGRAALLERTRPQFALTFGGFHRPGFRDECEVLVRRLPTGLPAGTPHCIVQSSSGTTGTGKAIGRTPESVLVELERLADLPGMPGPDEPTLLLDSWAYSFGLIGGVLHATRHGAPLVLPRRLNPPVPRHSPRVVIGAPRHFEALLGAPASALPDLRCAISGGESLHLGVFAAFARRFGVRIGQVYGITETGAIAADLTGRLAPQHVGAPLPGVRTAIRDGVLMVHIGQSPYVPGDPAWRGGWLATNDLVSRDPDTGVLRLRGRLSGQERPVDAGVDLVAIERVLRAHPGVTEAIVIGSDGIDALIVGDGVTGDEVTDWCLRVLGPGQPTVRCSVVSRLPRTPNGKYVRSRRVVSEAGASAAGEPARCGPELAR